MKLSFIIPVHNSEKYIVRCLESIFSQNVPERDFEVICIDDCSKDKSFSLLSSYATDHPNLVLLSHKRNRQQGAARNSGLRKARGEYIWFVDSDDFIEKDITGLLLQNVAGSKPDILQFNAKTVIAEGYTRHDPFLEDPIDDLSGLEYLMYEMKINYQNRLRAVWSKWYRREFLLQKNLFFQEGIYWEDVLHTLKAVCRAAHFRYIPAFAYNYVETPDSDLRGKMSGRKFADTIRFCADGLLFISNSDLDVDLVAFLGRRFSSTVTKYRSKIQLLTLGELILFFYYKLTLNLEILPQVMNEEECSWLLDNGESFRIWLKRFQ